NFQYESKSLGTGVIMGENESELLIATNNHVIDGASELTVSFIDEESVEAVVKGKDAGIDLAVVAVKLEDIPAETMGQIRIANVADSNEVRVGEQVVAIGNALGYGQSVTTGIVSALDRMVTVSDREGTNEYESLIQTDAAINQGNSGGALLNMRGEVIGINSVKAGSSGVEGMGYAIPTAKALPIIRNLMNKETRELVSDEELPYLGIIGQDVTYNVSQVYDIPIGIYVTEVSGGTPAEEAGITEGMVITGFDGNEVEDMSDLQKLLPYYRGGETVTITAAVQNDAGEYESQDLSVTLGLRSEYIQDEQ
ncbi:MAG: trypsin-like peptidase domain-containing protein, partial [Lachnospiraceae bacterium]|nr:trypsin-like peptidase domain-containing protein [Lachnospiraceae bacterium]